MDITCFDDLLRAARLQPEPQRLLFVFAASSVPDDATPEQKASHARGEGGELTPVLCVDKTPGELDAFAALVDESRRTGQDWQVVLFDVWMLAFFGAAGYLWTRLGCESAPLLLGLVLGQMMEENFRRALLLSRGDFTTFLTRPISLSLLIVAAGLLLLIAVPVIRRKRDEAFVEE